MKTVDFRKVKTRTQRRDCDHVDGRHHDCAYVDWRDSLVPLAEAVADVRVPELPDGSARLDVAARSVQWDAEYHREMRRLTTDPFLRARAVLSPVAVTA